MADGRAGWSGWLCQKPRRRRPRVVGLALHAQVVLRRDLEPDARPVLLGVREREHDARVASLAQQRAAALERIRRRGLSCDVLEEDVIEADDGSLGRHVRLLQPEVCTSPGAPPTNPRAQSPRCCATTSGLAISAPACRFFTRPSGPVTRKVGHAANAHLPGPRAGGVDENLAPDRAGHLRASRHCVHAHDERRLDATVLHEVGERAVARKRGLARAAPWRDVDDEAALRAAALPGGRVAGRGSVRGEARQQVRRELRGRPHEEPRRGREGEEPEQDRPARRAHRRRRASRVEARRRRGPCGASGRRRVSFPWRHFHPESPSFPRMGRRCAAGSSRSWPGSPSPSVYPPRPSSSSLPIARSESETSLRCSRSRRGFTVSP